MRIDVAIPDLETYDVIVTPSRLEEQCWAGAPATAVDEAGSVWLLYRLRTPEERGYALELARSDDGTTFEPVRTITARELGVRSVERGAFLRPPGTPGHELYLSYHAERWEIARARLTDGAIELEPIDTLFAPPGVTGVKDPVVLEARDGVYLLYTA
jgi:hypothetical protein